MLNESDEYHALIKAYLSGSASPEEAERFDRLMGENAEFRELFERMEQDLVPAFESIEPVAPPAGLLDRIFEDIDHADMQVPSSESSVVDHDFKQPARRAGPEPWRTISVLTSMAAAVAIGFHLVPDSPIVPVEESLPLLALMTGEEVPGLMVIVYDIEEREVLAKFSNTQAPDDAVWQLWLIRDGMSVPVSLGLMVDQSESGAIKVALEQDLQVGTDLLAVSLEPPGGSPLPGPSGPVLFTGKVEPL